MTQFKIIKGKFHVKGYQPDGDSIRFEADNPANWDAFQWDSVNKKKAAKKQLRIEAIDALETHYEGYHQPRPFALAALERLLKLLNIDSIKYSLNVTTIVDANDKQPGFIATDGLDRYDRPISILFPASANLTDGSLLTSPARDWSIPPSTPPPINFSWKRSAKPFGWRVRMSAASGPLTAPPTSSYGIRARFRKMSPSCPNSSAASWNSAMPTLISQNCPPTWRVKKIIWNC
jgi:hypothetical protein